MLRVLAVAASVTAALAFTSAASADRPVKEPAPAPEFTAGRFCADFDVLIHITVNKEYSKTFSSGATIVTGAFKGELTTLSTDKTVEINISGPVFVSPDGTTMKFTGRTLLFGEEGDFGAGSPPTLELTTGPSVLRLDSEGNVTGLTTTGHVIDMCQVLA